MCQIGEDKDGLPYLKNVFGDLPSAFYRAANLNLTFDDSEVQSGVINSQGNYFILITLLINW